MPAIEVLAERLDNHIKGDESTHGRLLREVADVQTSVNTLNTKFEVLNATLAPMIEHYMAEHPSKVHNMQGLSYSDPASRPKPKRKPISSELKLAGALFTFLTVASQALQAYLAHH